MNVHVGDAQLIAFTVEQQHNAAPAKKENPNDKDP